MKLIWTVIPYGNYNEEWAFTIADLVYLNQVVTNEGIKNIQIRFYPKDTTEFIPFEQ